MRSRLFTLLIMGLIALGAACGGETENEETLVTARVDKTQEGSLEYTYTEETQVRKVEVRGQIEDSVRHSESLLVDGQPVMERIVRDDALAIKVLLPGEVPQLESPEAADLAAAEALRAGQWVIDPSGAPAEGSAGPPVGKVGADPLTDAASIFQYIRLAVSQAAGVIRFNPDAIEYVPQEDPFPAPSKRIGEDRFDLVPPPLPKREGDVPPGPAAFRKMSIYVAKGRLVRVLEQIDIDSQPEIKRARQTGRNKFLVSLAQNVKQGKGAERIDERKMAFEIISHGGPITVPVPGDGFIGNLSVLFGQKTNPRTANEGEPVPSSTLVPPSSGT